MREGLKGDENAFGPPDGSEVEYSNFPTAMHPTYWIKTGRQGIIDRHASDENRRHGMQQQIMQRIAEAVAEHKNAVCVLVSVAEYEPHNGICQDGCR